MSEDYMIRAIAADGAIRAFAINSRDIAEEARKRHNTSPVVTAALGRLLSAAAMMGIMMKGEDDILTVQIRSDGPIRGLTVTADSHGRVKGYAWQPYVILPARNGKLDVGGAVGAGVLNVIKDLGLKDPYVGQTDLVSGEIAEDLTYYFATSEQTPSSVGLGVLMNRDNTVRQSGGFIIQIMPDADEAVVSELEQRLASVSSVTDMLDEGYTPRTMLEYLLEGFDLTVTEKIPASFYCGCSKERVTKTLISLGRDELQDMIDDGEPVEVRCDMCGSVYTFDVEELASFLKDD